MNEQRAGIFKSIFSARYIRAGLGIVLSVVALVLSTRDVNFHEVWAVLKGAKPAFILLGACSVGLNITGKALRWQVLLSSGRKTKFSYLLMAMMAGQLVNLFVPGRAGDISRVWIAGSEAGRTFVLGTVVLEKMIDTLVYGVLFGVLLLLIPLPQWIENSAITVFFIFLVCFLTLIGAVSFRVQLWVFAVHLGRRLPGSIQGWLLPRLEAGLSSLNVLDQITNLFWIVFWTMVIWGTALLNNQAVLWALGLNLPFSTILLVLVGLQASIAVTASPGGIGVFEYICVLALGVFGVTQRVSVGYGFVLHALVFIPQILGGLISLVWWSFKGQAAVKT